MMSMPIKKQGKPKDIKREKLMGKPLSEKWLVKKKPREREREKKLMRKNGFGPIFTCSCCHRRLFENGVTQIPQEFRDKVNRKVPYSSIIPEKQEVHVRIVLDGRSSLSGFFICRTCKSTMLNGKMPCMAVQNGLQLPQMQDDLT